MHGIGIRHVQVVHRALRFPLVPALADHQHGIADGEFRMAHMANVIAVHFAALRTEGILEEFDERISSFTGK